LTNVYNDIITSGFNASAITVIDLGSTNQEIFDVYTELEQNGSKLVVLSDAVYGPWSLWCDNRLQGIFPDIPFIVTDADISLDGSLNLLTLEYSLSLLKRNPLVDKISWHLKTSDIDVENAHSVRYHELWKISRLRVITLLLRRFRLINNQEYFSTSDTTLSLYRPVRDFSGFSIFLSPDFSIRHLPWYNSFRETKEFRYYQQHKNPNFGHWS